MDSKTRSITFSAVLGAAYAVLTVVLAPISYGSLQMRVSEALCVMPFFIAGSAWGLCVGCVLANLINGNIFDVIFGSLATLFAGFCTAAVGKRSRSAGAAALACLMPVIFNAVVVGAVITAAYNGMNIFAHLGIFALNAAQIAVGEALVMYLFGFPLIRYLPQKKFFRDFVEKSEGGRL